MALQNKVVIDTNMLLSVKKFKIDIFEEVKKMIGDTKFVITDKIEKEMSFLEQKGKNFSFEKKLIEKNNVKTEKTDAKTTDESLEELAEKNYFVATNDKELIKKIKKKGGKVIFIRKKSFLKMA